MFVSNSFDIPNLGEPYERKILLRNTLKVPVVFKIRQSCQLSLKISHTTGIIKENSIQVIKIRYVHGFKKLVNNEVPKHFDIFIRLYEDKKKEKIYKWLKNEISEPNHLAHRFILRQGTGYISSTFVFDIPCKASILEPVLFPSSEDMDDNCRTAIQIDEGTTTAQRILNYPKEFLYNNNNNNLYHYDYHRLDGNLLTGTTDVQTYTVERNKSNTNGIIYAAIEYLFGGKNNNNDSMYSCRESDRRVGFLC
uniref:Major sperm protein n=1 Tax=Strongyloides papillosus TaxID=174720 RepID=A0A0N5BAS1_STREA